MMGYAWKDIKRVKLAATPFNVYESNWLLQLDLHYFDFLSANNNNNNMQRPL